MLSLKEFLSLLFSGGRVKLLIHGEWRMGLRKFISSQLHCKFVRIVRGANEAANALAKEGSEH